MPRNDSGIIKNLPKIPLDAQGPVFGEPWQAQAFAMTLKMRDSGAFTWEEWAQALGAQIKIAGPDDPAENYYLHWLSALENILADKNILPHSEREKCKSEWEVAARHTPHGTPIKLKHQI